MKTITRNRILLLLSAILFAAASCKKENTTTAGEQISLPSGAIAVTSGTATEDAVYLVNTCPKGGKLDSVAFSALPAATVSYLSANYTGYTFQKAFKAKSANGAADSYVVVISFNGKPVGLKFDTAGTFVSIFEQREARDLKNKGWHPGGRFDMRDGRCRDTLALSALPAAVKTYFTTNFAQDTLLHATTTKDGSFLVISASKGLFISAFSPAGVFVKRTAITEPAKRSEVALAALPAVARTYLTNTFAGYVFNKAYVLKTGTAVKGYTALIDASGTKYAVAFNASGDWIKTVTVR
ncbi:PepSY-like domain-containing protein [Hufsiella ginkgonis]|uniref:Beta-lactamase-inhibitor-like PepSY-like domain-containing protein n=1 Tax=Hufsiella ginkgonis TaxID=2695274 RepID=A0A7K1XUI3_9SPHI|nr:PepSY-like domain-containing protein [Hufsiella ginkgonis]MXV14644.1 hypothetical protein [Hufsiella ginkgonis]